MLRQTERNDSTQNQNQSVFIRGFRISIRDSVFSAVLRGPLEISPISNSRPEDILGLQGGYSPFSQPNRWTRNWFAGGWFGSGSNHKHRRKHRLLNRQASTLFYSDQSSEKQPNVPDIVLDPISTTPEVVLII